MHLERSARYRPALIVIYILYLKGPLVSWSLKEAKCFSWVATCLLVDGRPGQIVRVRVMVRG